MSVQPQTDRKVVTAVKDLASSLPVDGKMEVLSHLLSELSAKDFETLPPGTRQTLLEVLPAGKVAAATVAPSTPLVSIELAEKILGTLEVAEDGFAKLTIPASVSEVEAMMALNLYFNEKVPGIKPAAICEGDSYWYPSDTKRPAIWGGDFHWYEKQSTVSSRHISKERKIEINVMVEGTLHLSRAEQIEVIKTKGMTLGAPEEVALVVAAYACKDNGKDLLRGFWTCTAVPGVALATSRLNGVYVAGYCDVGGDSIVGASGVRSSSN